MTHSLLRPAVTLRGHEQAVPHCRCVPEAFHRRQLAGGGALLQQRHRGHPTLTTAAQRGGGGGGRRGGGRPPGRRVPPPDPTLLLQQYGLPALGLLIAASLVGPLIAGIVFTALGLGVAIAAAAATLSVSSVVVLPLVALFGMPALMAGGMAAGVFATAAAGALLLPGLVQLVLVGGGLWLGAAAAQRLFYSDGGEDATGGPGGYGIDDDGTINVEARSVDDADWRDEVLE